MARERERHCGSKYVRRLRCTMNKQAKTRKKDIVRAGTLGRQRYLPSREGTKGWGGLISSIISCCTEGVLSIQEEFEGWVLGAGSVVIVCILWALYSMQWAEC